ncbi:MAG: peptidoglycan D,D-transpeptidase FtsI family protein [Candidatus Lariskella arthropodorum]
MIFVIYQRCKNIIKSRLVKNFDEGDSTNLNSVERAAHSILQQKNLLQDYETEKKLDVSIPRLYCIFAIFTFALLVIVLRMMDLTFMNIEEVDSIYNKTYADFTTSRADILDRNGEILASNISTASLHAHPKQLIDANKAAKQIASLDIGLNYRDLYNKFNSGKEFIWLKRHLTPSEQQKVHNLGIPGIYLSKDSRRVYTYENLFSHILGYVDVDGIGIAGIEKSYQERLITEKKEPMQLSLDARVQHALYKVLKDTISANSADGGVAAVMNVNNGEIVGIVSLPDFNPHKLSSVKRDHLFNQATLGVYEMGSPFKLFTVAMGLDTGKISVNDAFDVSHPIKIGKFQINDYRGKGGTLSVPEIIMYSSNLGVAQIAKLIGIKQHKQYIQNLGLTSEINFDVPEIGKPIYPRDNKWGEVSATTISYGHGIAVTPIHLMQAISAIVNNGILYQPTVIKHAKNTKIISKRVIKAETSELMRKILKLSVEHGSAKNAYVKGYSVGGKTGTAEKNSGGRYNKKLNIALFTGAFPIHKPEYMVLVMVDAPKPCAYNSWRATGGAVAAPAASEIIKLIAPILGIQSSDKEEAEILEAMRLNYTPQYKTLANR